MDVTRLESYRPGMPAERDVEARVSAVHDYAVRIARQLGRSLAHEDLAQDVVERYLRQDPPPDNLKAWTRTVTRNLATDTWRSAYANRVRLIGDRDAGGETDGATLEDLGQAVYGPSAAVMDREMAAEVLAAVSVGDLAVLLDHLDGRSHADIAERHGYASPRLVATKIHRAKRRLQERFPDVGLLVNPQRPY
jgi:DNA-directed RNA polymerase specialized sigma24 family protein